MADRRVDAAWLNGRVFTGTGFAEAFLAEGGVVRAVGDRRAVLRAKATGTETRDLHGRLVVPGLVDAHLHLGDAARSLASLDLRGCRNLSDLQRRVRAAQEPSEEGPLFGYGWDEQRWPDRRAPTRGDLDRIAPDRPLFLFRTCRHVALLNGAALAQLGLSGRDRDPPGGSFGRDAAGGLNGLLFDEALQPIERLLREWVTRHPREVGAFLQRAASLGLTTIATMNAAPEELRVLSHLRERGPLPVRVRCYLDLRRIGEMRSLPTAPSDRAWTIHGVKAILDGSLGARTAWLGRPYADAPDQSGYPLWEAPTIAAHLEQAVWERLPIALHAIGDRALSWALRLLTRVPAALPVRIEHASLLVPGIVARLRRRRVGLAIQPGFARSDSWIVQRLGPTRARRAHAFRTLIESGLTVAGSSDAPVEPLDPWDGMRAAVHRAPGSEFGRITRGERLAPLEALRLYSSGGGELLREPGVGGLAPGGPADFVLLNAPSIEAALASSESPVAETWHQGRRVFRRGTD